MKISREARQHAKQIYRACHAGGQLDAERLRKAVQALIAQKPRHYIPILERIRKLLELETHARTVRIESAVPLPDQGQSVIDQLARQYGPAMATDISVLPELIGGMRISRGSDVWDGTVLGRLNQLRLSLTAAETA
jgi:F-type H+-transporting ATPase subunit delta